MFLAKVYVRLKKGLLDPQGKAIEGAIGSMGFTGIEDIKVGKLIDIKLKAKDRGEAEKRVKQICEKLLVNPVIEVATFDLEAIS